MGLVTYILLTGLVLGTQNRSVNHNNTNYYYYYYYYLYRPIRFSPEQLGISASSLLAWLIAEIVLIWFSLFLFQVNSRLSWLDIVVYCSYKYVRYVT